MKRPMKRPTSAGIKDMTSELNLCWFDKLVEFGDFKPEQGIVLHPRTTLFIFLYFPYVNLFPCDSCVRMRAIDGP